jgi:hypothetical protein
MQGHEILRLALQNVCNKGSGWSGQAIRVMPVYGIADSRQKMRPDL